MGKKGIGKALVDGCIVGLFAFALCEYGASIFFSFDSALLSVLAVTLSLVISTISAIYNLDHQSTRYLLMSNLLSLTGCICFLFAVFALLVSPIPLPRLLPQRDLGNGDGIIIILLDGAYLIGTICIRMIIFFWHLIRIHREKRADAEK